MMQTIIEYMIQESCRSIVNIFKNDQSEQLEIIH